MRPKSSDAKSRAKASAEAVVKDIRRATRRHFSAEAKIRIVLEGLRGDDSIAELCRKEGIAQSLYYTWSKEFMEAGKRRLAGDTARAATTGEVHDLRREAGALKECVADLTLENRLLKKSILVDGRPRMRYPASEKLEIIRIVEQSNLPARRTLEQLGIPRRTFCRWYDRYLEGGPEALEDRPSAPRRVWNRIPPEIHDQIIQLALEQSELSPRELAVRFTDEKRYFVSEATVYRLLKAHDLITSPAYVVIKAANEFQHKTTRPNEIWQTDFTYFKIIGWAGCICRPCSTTACATSSPGNYAARPVPPPDPGQDRALAPDLKNRILLENYFLPGDLEAQVEAFVEHYNHRRYHESLDNVTPADAYFGRAETIIRQRERIKRQTIEHRRLQHRKLAA